MMFPKIFLLLYSTFKSERSANNHESEQQDSVNQEIETEIKAFLAEEVKEDEVLSLWNSNKKKIYTSCQVCKKVSFGSTILCLL